MKNSRKVGLAVGLFVVLSAFSLVLWQGVTQGGISAAYAQGGPTATPAAPGNAPNRAGGPFDVNAFWTALAARLGIGVDDLKSKAVAAQKDVIEQQVKDGKLTRAQADQLEQRLDANGVPFIGEPHGGPGGGRGGPFGVPGGVKTLDAVAKALILTTADLNAQLQSGKTLADVAKAQRVDEATLKQVIIDAAKADIQSKVQSGQLTQAQADQMLSRLTPAQIDLTRPLGHPGPRGGTQ